MSNLILKCCWLAFLASIPPAHPFLSPLQPQQRLATNNVSRHGRLRSLPPNLETLVAETIDSDRKIVIVTGGVLSGIGKGVTASSMGVVSENYCFTCSDLFLPMARTYPYHFIELMLSSSVLWAIVSLPLR